jgi:hypothetical protein
MNKSLNKSIYEKTLYSNDPLNKNYNISINNINSIGNIEQI